MNEMNDAHEQCNSKFIQKLFAILMRFAILMSFVINEICAMIRAGNTDSRQFSANLHMFRVGTC